MQIKQYVIDAFTPVPFHGNPAAVCLLPHWLADSLLQQIAAENNLAETAFLVRAGERWQLRWFTPLVEIELCGHATLASAFVLAGHLPDRKEFRFSTQSGELIVTREGELFTLDFPERTLQQIDAQHAVSAILGQPVQTVLLAAKTWIAVLANATSVRQLQPDFAAIKQLECRGLIITARGDDCDFVSRFFAPKMGIDEDPVTGSAHCGLVPYWSAVLGKTRLHARQLSPRGGELFCEYRQPRVLISGHAVQFASGHIEVPDTSL